MYIPMPLKEEQSNGSLVLSNPDPADLKFMRVKEEQEEDNDVCQQPSLVTKSSGFLALPRLVTAFSGTRIAAMEKEVPSGHLGEELVTSSPSKPDKKIVLPQSPKSAENKSPKRTLENTSENSATNRIDEVAEKVLESPTTKKKKRAARDSDSDSPNGKKKRKIHNASYICNKRVAELTDDDKMRLRMLVPLNAEDIDQALSMIHMPAFPTLEEIRALQALPKNTNKLDLKKVGRTKAGDDSKPKVDTTPVKAPKATTPTVTPAVSDRVNNNHYARPHYPSIPTVPRVVMTPQGPMVFHAPVYYLPSSPPANMSPASLLHQRTCLSRKILSQTMHTNLSPTSIQKGPFESV